jgi:3-methyladenine DNA glycosylase AlkC
MAEPFKQFINAPLVEATSGHLARVWPAFDARTFVAQATHDLDALEMKARAMRIADALEQTLPQDFSHAADVIEASLAAPSAGEQMAGLSVTDTGLAGWILWPVGEYVARRGLAHPERALRALHAMTQRFTAEFAIRPFLVAHPSLVFDTLADWVHDDSAHVRRLVSEGSRPRLPWGIRLHALVADPSPSLPLLEALQDDDSEYVRRSVANHLNDIAKDHPALVADWLDQHLPSASVERRALLRHASRTLIKQGDSRVMHAWGVGAAFEGNVTVEVTPEAVSVGARVELTVTMTSTSSRAQSLAVDYLVHFVKADGSTSPKVFKGWVLSLEAHEQRTMVKRHSLRVITTRRYYPGVHAIEVQVNGASVGRASFTLRAASV